jgi:hypothetical protein
VITGCVFEANSSDGSGGAARLNAGTISGCSFVGNSAPISGGALLVTDSFEAVVVVRDCHFEDNSTGAGAGISIGGPQMTATVESCTFIDNDANGGGGLIVRSGATAVLDRCVLRSNRALTGNRQGGAIVVDDATLTLTRGTLYENAAVFGGGVYLEGSAVATLNNAIIAGSTQGAAIVCEGSSSATLGCCDLVDNAGGDWIGCIAAQAAIDGNLSAVPLFCDPTGDDLSLQPTSPCAPAQAGACGLIGALEIGCSD